jgi:RimJ/RimL family protein N-acetyltransferase
VTFTRTQDEAIIRRIATHPKIWPMLADDLASSPEAWKPVLHDGVWYVLAEEKGELHGLYVFFPENSVCWHVHISMLPEFWGGAARTSKQIFHWIWEQTACTRIVGSIPVWNGPAICCALRAGMKPYGVNQHSSLKDARLHHQLLVGISRPREKAA